MDELAIMGRMIIRLSLSLNSAFEIRLEKYRKIINNPLIIIKNKRIDRIKLNFQRDIFKQIIKV